MVLLLAEAVPAVLADLLLAACGTLRGLGAAVAFLLVGVPRCDWARWCCCCCCCCCLCFFALVLGRAGAMNASTVNGPNEVVGVAALGALVGSDDGFLALRGC